MELFVTYGSAAILILGVFSMGCWWGGDRRGNGQAAAAKGGMLAILGAVELRLQLTKDVDMVQEEINRLRAQAEKM